MNRAVEAEKAKQPKRVVCPDCGQSTWREGFGCDLPGCENHGVLVGKAPVPAPVLAVVTDVDPPTSELWDSIKDTVTPDEVWEAAKTIDDGGYQIEDLQRAVVKNRQAKP